MLKSMTAYVSISHIHKGCPVSCDIKSVNGKSLDINFKSNFILPKAELAIRELISNLNKSSFNEKPRFVLIDNIEYLNVNSINALLKVLEEPSFKVHFILINNNKKILPTLLSRCINFKISLSNKENFRLGRGQSGF